MIEIQKAINEHRILVFGLPCLIVTAFHPGQRKVRTKQIKTSEQTNKNKNKIKQTNNSFEISAVTALLKFFKTVFLFKMIECKLGRHSFSQSLIDGERNTTRSIVCNWNLKQRQLILVFKFKKKKLKSLKCLNKQHNHLMSCHLPLQSPGQAVTIFPNWRERWNRSACPNRAERCTVRTFRVQHIGNTSKRLYM